MPSNANSTLAHFSAPPFHPILLEPIDRLPISARAKNRLATKNLRLLGDLIQETAQSLREIENFGLTTLHEIKRFLAANGLELGSSLPGWNEQVHNAANDAHAANTPKAPNSPPVIPTKSSIPSREIQHNANHAPTKTDEYFQPQINHNKSGNTRMTPRQRGNTISKARLDLYAERREAKAAEDPNYLVAHPLALTWHLQTFEQLVELASTYKIDDIAKQFGVNSKTVSQRLSRLKIPTKSILDRRAKRQVRTSRKG